MIAFRRWGTICCGRRPILQCAPRLQTRMTSDVRGVGSDQGLKQAGSHLATVRLGNAVASIAEIGGTCGIVVVC